MTIVLKWSQKVLLFALTQYFHQGKKGNKFYQQLKFAPFFFVLMEWEVGGERSGRTKKGCIHHQSYVLVSALRLQNRKPACS